MPFWITASWLKWQSQICCNNKGAVPLLSCLITKGNYFFQTSEFVRVNHFYLTWNTSNNKNMVLKWFLPFICHTFKAFNSQPHFPFKSMFSSDKVIYYKPVSYFTWMLSCLALSLFSLMWKPFLLQEISSGTSNNNKCIS